MGFHQPPHIHVRTDLRGIDAGMPQNDLNYSQVNSSFQEVRGKGMAKCVWAHIVRMGFLQSGGSYFYKLCVSPKHTQVIRTAWR